MNTIKSFSRLLLLVVTVGFFISCSTTKKDTITFEEDPPFQIERAYYQNWVAGIPEGGSGTNVNVSFSSIDANVVIEYFYFNDKVIKPIASPQFRDQYTGSGTHYRGYFRNDLKEEIIMSSDPVLEAQNVLPQKPPFQMDANQLVIGYRFQGRKLLNYYKLPFISERPMTAFPQNNPNGTD